MTTQEKLKQYRDWIFKCSAYRMTLSIIGTGKQTVAPSTGAIYRDERSSYPTGELFNPKTDPGIIVFLKELKDDPAVDAETKCAVQPYCKSVMSMMCIPKEEFVTYQKLCDESFGAWTLTKSKADCSIFEPYLKRVTESQKKLCDYRESDQSVYDQMLDDFEPGMAQEKYNTFFTALKECLVPLIRKVTAAKRTRENSLHLEYPVEKQRKFMNELLIYLHFDPSQGYRNESEHPFVSSAYENDCRTTTKYIPDSVVSMISSMVHEVGHIYYKYDVDPKYDDTILSGGAFPDMHESQSRLCENYLARTEAFWRYHYPKLKAQLPKQLDDVSLEDFLKAVNASKSSFIRTEAGELTYPMYILIRYEIEKGLFDGTISTGGLDKTQNAKYKEYPGVDVSNTKVGILQDMHWSGGSFGYFSTYALGMAFVTQFVHTMRKELGVNKLLENNQYGMVMGWLKECIHRYGCRYDAPELMKLVTGEDFDVSYFLDYTEEKCTELYQL